MFEPLSGPARKVALVVGGYSAVGRIVCERLITDGFTTAVAGSTTDAARLYGEALAGEQPRVLPYVADLAEGDSVDKAVADILAELGRIDVVVGLTSAGAGPAATSSDATGSDVTGSDPAGPAAPGFDMGETHHPELTGMYRLGQAAVRAMPAPARPGRIVLLATPTHRQGVWWPAGAVLAAGTSSLVAGWSALLPATGTTVNAVVPGRNAAPDAIAAAILLLLRPDAHGITGQSVHVRG
ncbi:SDR family NAD(P)-dependent oxidoreductase [Streptomyces sp. S.PNR 29]|uniref:SDR family NAD(P)-dependent oxidoreductase n=1 Tax=Streptomyces sp. S.PNR 29 TaxID=2973805 RepID=UPI0025B2474E|nr:SDR family NAD(P)-dependent oxidoreductase [Streptomyces sp. S.PNR 29]MDN0201085.1 SDR family oxidoreductase [Streptomyces sp. S.PNR 29]